MGYREVCWEYSNRLNSWLVVRKWLGMVKTVRCAPLKTMWSYKIEMTMMRQRSIQARSHTFFDRYQQQGYRIDRENKLVCVKVSEKGEVDDDDEPEVADVVVCAVDVVWL